MPIKQNHLNIRLIGILRTKPKTPADNAVNAIQTSFDAGAKAIEITSNSDHWQDIVDECVKRNLNIGVGSIKNESTAKEAIHHGAKFLVSPGLFTNTISVAQRKNVPILPGVYLESELYSAAKLGIADIKFFPANVKTHEEFYKAIREPFRDEFEELSNLGWKILPLPLSTSLPLPSDFIIESPTQFYELYLKVREQKSAGRIVIKLPDEVVGFNRLEKISKLASEHGIRTYAVGGVNDKNMKEVLTKYGAHGVCPGSGMFSGDAIVNGDVERVRAAVTKHVSVIKELFAAAG